MAGKVRLGNHRNDRPVVPEGRGLAPFDRVGQVSGVLAEDAPMWEKSLILVLHPFKQVLEWCGTFLILAPKLTTESLVPIRWTSERRSMRAVLP